ncbi:MAG: GTPase [archaeon]
MIDSNILVDRINIGIFGKMNAGKSTIMNLLTAQQTSIVDSAPGTTTDVKQAILEIHGFGPVKIFDTAGLNEFSALGEKKKLKALNALKESDLILLIIDPVELLKKNEFHIENEVMALARQYGKQVLFIYNIFQGKLKESSISEKNLVDECSKNIYHAPDSKFLALDALEKDANKKLLEFIKNNFVNSARKTELLPFLDSSGFVAMNIPVDEETPEGRLLRPQNAVLDYLLRRFIPFAGFRMDLTKARSPIKEIQEEEHKKYLAFLNELNRNNKLQLLVTDSQAIDIVSRWTPKEIPITTFSIIMINYQSNGNLHRLVEGLKALDALKENDSILVAEACNHDRKCDDIGTKQIPMRIKQKLNLKNLNFDFNFGREFPQAAELKKYKLLIHCGGCMVDSQKINSRFSDLMNLNIPVTNYGLLLSYLEGKETLNRVLKPWGFSADW